MAFEGAQMVPVYDMNKSDNAGMMGGGAGWMWVVMLFFLLAWGGGFGGFGGANGAAKPIATLMLFVQKTTKTLVKSLLQFMRKLKQLAR